MEDFDICLGDPEQVEMSVYDLWIQGMTLDEAMSKRMSTIGDAIRRFHSTPGGTFHLCHRRSNAFEDMSGNALDHPEVLYMVKQDTCDSFRLFEILEKYLYQPETFRFQNICQLPLNDRLKMVEKYYELDDIVAREITWRRPTSKKVAKELDDISDLTQVPLRSCRRQFDNLRRAYSYIEEQRSFSAEEQRCVVCDDLRRYLLLPGPLACKYTAYVFLTFHKFEFKSLLVSSSSRRRPPPFTFPDVEFVALAIMTYWVPDVRNLAQQGTGVVHTPIMPQYPSASLLSPGPAEPPPSIPSEYPQIGTPLFLRENTVGRDSSADSVPPTGQGLGHISGLGSSFGGHYGGLGGSGGYPPINLATRSLRSESFGGALAEGAVTWAEALAGAALLMEEMMMEEGASGQGTTPSHQRLQDALKNVCGVELDKVLLGHLKEISRFFNDSTAMDQFQGLVISSLAGQASQLPSPLATWSASTGPPPTHQPPLGLINDTAKILAIARKFRNIIRPILALGWGLQHPKELRDLFEDIIIKVAEPLRELQLSRRDTASLFLAMSHTLNMVPQLTDKGLTARRLRMVILSWTRFLSGIALVLLRTYDRWGNYNYYGSSFSDGSFLKKF